MDFLEAIEKANDGIPVRRKIWTNPRIHIITNTFDLIFGGSNCTTLYYPGIKDIIAKDWEEYNLLTFKDIPVGTFFTCEPSYFIEEAIKISDEFSVYIDVVNNTLREIKIPFDTICQITRKKG